MRIEENVPLAPMTTIGIGGPARFFVRARGVDEIRAALDFARERAAGVFVLAGGSNVLVADEGFDGLVIRVELKGISVEPDGDAVIVRAAAGESWDEVVALAARNGWAGVECLSGIPGSVGATPIQNVGAYGQEVGDAIVRVEALERDGGGLVAFARDDCRFGYRSSIFKEQPGRWLVTGVLFRLRPGGCAVAKYPELQRALQVRGVAAGDLEGVRETVLGLRRSKGMVLDADDPDSRSDGSFFVNPVLTAAAYDSFAQRVPEAPHYASGGGVKLSAAWLIERAGFARGFVHGNVGLSSKHALAIINRGGGTAREVVELMSLIQNAVRERFGVELRPEPVFAGPFAHERR